MDVPEIPRFAELSTEADINYLCNIPDNKEYNMKYLPKEKLIVIVNPVHLDDSFHVSDDDANNLKVMNA